MIVLDDYLVRDLVADRLSPELSAIDDNYATTNLWLFRLAGALSRQGLGGRLAGPVKELGPTRVARFRQELADRLQTLTIVPMQEIVWSMAELQAGHGDEGRNLSAAMAEALAAAELLGAGIAVADVNVGPGLEASAATDGVPFHVIAF